ncbi:universal stress protein [Nitrincola tibetensis]|uniref:Universal stress protein n=1 Tax=Nitrincola tibetensis TaxID=2219697 RepID=A0A364NPE4_9GAMM|nr:universal stress protein [Nitrincola tibetensis]RAU18914.1 universal stress protein [Nitrincola tibetensis]
MLPKVRTIVYASDIAEGSRPAFRMAVEQAVRHEAHIIFLHAIEPPVTDADAMIRDYLISQAQLKHTRQLMDQYRAKIEQRISDFLESEIPSDIKLKKAPQIEVRIGKPDTVIVDVARSQNADLIVMGDRGGSTASRIFLGSTTQKVIQQTSTPVLIVPLKGK